VEKSTESHFTGSSEHEEIDGEKTAFTITRLEPGLFYDVVIQALDADFRYSELSEATRISTTAPNALLGLATGSTLQSTEAITSP